MSPTNWWEKAAGIRGRILGIERRIQGRNSEESLDIFSEFEESKKELQRGERGDRRISRLSKWGEKSKIEIRSFANSRRL